MQLTRRLKSSLMVTLSFLLLSSSFLGINSVAIPTMYAEDFPVTIENPDFKSGDLTGWTTTGTAFQDGPKQDEFFWGDRPFAHQGNYHMWTWNEEPSADERIGTMQSTIFQLSGNGEVNFLVGGAKDLEQFYVALVRVSDGKEVFKATGNALPDHFERYVRVRWDASEYLGEYFYIKVVDNGNGHINVDDFNVYNVTTDIVNGGFESGDLRGWMSTGEAFRYGVISDDIYGTDDNPYHHVGKYHLGGTSTLETGTLQSTIFQLSGNGLIHFLIAGSKDIDNQYIALMRASDDEELFRATGKELQDLERSYSRVIWDASEYIGEELYLKIVDNGQGYIIADDFRVYNTNHNIVNPDFETGDLTGWTTLEGDDLSQYITHNVHYWHADPINKQGFYHLWGDDNAIGTIRSTDFILGGTGEINFLIGGGNQGGQYVALRKSSDDSEIFRAHNEQFMDSEVYSRVVWDASAYLGEALYIVIADEVAGGGWQHINADDFQVYNFPYTIENPDFESGDLSGWTLVEGEIPGRVTSDVDYWHADPVNKQGEYHFWGEDGKAGVFVSNVFELAGTGEINFLIGGGNFPYTSYVSLVRASDDRELITSTNTMHDDSESYNRMYWDASAYIGEQVYLKVVDLVSGGGWQHINVDDFQLLSLLPNDLLNASFETGDLSGWHIDGNAFVVSDMTEFEGKAFNHVGTYHIFGGGDAEATGTLTSQSFKLTGTGEIQFLVSGSQDLNNYYVELVRSDDDQTLFKATGYDDSTYRRVVWNASDYVGKEVYLRVVDNGGGYINVDDFVVYNNELASYILYNEDFERNGLAGWELEGSAFQAVSGAEAKIRGYQRSVYAQGDAANEGSLTSSPFRLAGSGEVNFKLAGTASDDVYVAVYREADNKELKRAFPRQKDRFEKITWDLSDYLNEVLYIKVVDEGDQSAIHVDDFNYYVSNEILNSDFESGDLRGWNVIDGTTFADRSVVSSKTKHHGSESFFHHGNYHVWGYNNGGDDQIGSMESTHFILDETVGTGRITFYIAGGSHESADVLGVQLIRDSTGEVLFETTGFNDEVYSRIDWDASAYLGEELFFRVNDYARGGWGHINVDNFMTVNPYGNIINGSFESGDLSGWSATGQAFAKPFKAKSGNEGSYFISSKQDPKLVGSLRSRDFELNGNGLITFLIAGGNDLENLNVSLVNSLNDEVLFTATGSNSDVFREVTWDASSYTGQEVYLNITDILASGEFAYLSVDDFEISTAISAYEQDYRPQYHYSPEKGWMNDPNGLVYYEGEYHLFYQYTPHSIAPDFGAMHWGHAVSADLVHWEELPFAIAPDEDGAIFSGSAVVDHNNTSGFFNEEGSGLVAIYTNNDNKRQPGKPQVQSIAYSKDKGRTWTKYEGNPVLFPDTTLDFRDPKVIWHEQAKHWVMSLAVQDRVEFYISPDLKTWSFASSFGSDIIGTHRGIYECPDLFPIYVDGDPNKVKWVLILSVGDRNGVDGFDPEPPAGGSGMMYFVGEFDGTTFTLDKPIESAEDVQWIDHGSDFYAAVTFSDVPEEDGRKLWIGWMNNWRYATAPPTSPWKGNMSIPRELKLVSTDEGVQLIQVPVEELEGLKKEIYAVDNIQLQADSVSPIEDLSIDKAEIIAEFEVGTAAEFGFKVRKSDEEETVVGYDAENSQLFVDRTSSSVREIHGDFAAKHTAPMPAINEKVKLRIYLDMSSIEVLGNDGATAISDLIFPSKDSTGFELYSIGGEAKLVSLQINEINSVWRDESIRRIRAQDREYTMKVGDTYQATVYTVAHDTNAGTYGAELTNIKDDVTYLSSNVNVATVDANGKVTARRTGNAVITMTHGGYEAIVNMKVEARNNQDVEVSVPPTSDEEETVSIINKQVTINKKAEVNSRGIALVELSVEELDKAIELINRADQPDRIVIQVNGDKSATEYNVQFPKYYLTMEQAEVEFLIVTPLSSFIITSDAVLGVETQNTSVLSIIVRRVDTANVDVELGNVKVDTVMQYEIKANQQSISWDQLKQAVTIVMHYEPTAEELNNIGVLTVVALDNEWQASPLKFSVYDQAAKGISFTPDARNSYAITSKGKEFVDLAKHQWAKDAIDVLAVREIIRGISDSSFNPTGQITRADFLLMLMNVLDVRAEEKQGSFSDVTENAYYYEAVTTALALGIANGTGDHKFNPQSVITREDMLVLTLRALKVKHGHILAAQADTPNYSDMEHVSSYAIEAVSLLSQEGLIQGYNAKIKPKDHTTRAEAAVIIHRIWSLIVSDK